MKIPYIKLYTADVLAKSRKLNHEQIGRLVLSACELAFEGSTDLAPQNETEIAFCDMLNEWIVESKTAIKQKKIAGKNGAKKRWKEKQLSDGSTAISCANSTTEWHTDTDTDTDTKTDNIILHTAVQKTADKTSHPKKLNELQKFAIRVLESFEPDVKTKDQKSVWYKRNCRCLRDILAFCEGNIELGIKTIDVCLDRMSKACYTCGYEAVLRNIPEYYSVAKMKMERTYAKKD